MVGFSSKPPVRTSNSGPPSPVKSLAQSFYKWGSWCWVSAASAQRQPGGGGAVSASFSLHRRFDMDDFAGRWGRVVCVCVSSLPVRAGLTSAMAQRCLLLTVSSGREPSWSVYHAIRRLTRFPAFRKACVRNTTTEWNILYVTTTEKFRLMQNERECAFCLFCLSFFHLLMGCLSFF